MLKITSRLNIFLRNQPPCRLRTIEFIDIKTHDQKINNDRTHKKKLVHDESAVYYLPVVKSYSRKRVILVCSNTVQFHGV